MANIKSQIKRNRTNEARRMRNKGVKSALRTYIKKFQAALGSGDIPGARTALAKASQELDRAASKGVIHPNSAANRKSRIARALARASAGGS